MQATQKSLRARVCLMGAVLGLGVSLASSAEAASFVFNAGSPDFRLGALSRRPDGAGKIETETADDFLLQETTVLKSATIHGVIPAGTPASGITSVEIEIYHIFSLDSTIPPSGRVPSRLNSPSDVEIDSATRDAKNGSLRFNATVTTKNVSVATTVVNGIHAGPVVVTHGEGPASGDLVEITVTFTKPIVLPAGHYFFRPEVGLATGDFLFVSAPRPMQAPATVIPGDLQAWIRNAALAPDWLRIGTDIIGGDAPPTFNMSYSLAGETIAVGTPGQANCHGQTISALSYQFGGIDAAAAALGFSSVAAFQDTFRGFCEE
jgi:hypothetical protein